MTASSTRSRTDAALARLPPLVLACALALLWVRLPAEARPAKHVDEKEQAARAKLVTGTQAYNLGQFEAALRQYEEAYALAPHLGFLFNIAQCHRHLRNYEQAIFNYRRYLAEGRLSRENEAVVQDLIREMEEKKADLEMQHRAEVEATRQMEIERARAAAVKAEAEGAEKRRAEAALQGLNDRLPPPPPAPEPLYKKWWLWAGIGAVATGAIVYAAIPAHPRNTTLGSVSAR